MSLITFTNSTPKAFCFRASAKTAAVAKFLKTVGIDGRVLFLGETNVSFAKSVRNLPKAQFMIAGQASGYDLAKAKQIVVTPSALTQLQERLS